ncbi:hypothetical protein CCMA1212_004471 [Trichoderma ghanense]|uniref:SSCRP protein n=1 Tax=Trichoderma ghanense TaxID=65468 RepID=A0ABY2H824_9HYPO
MYKSGSKPLAPPTAKISIRRTDALLVRVDSVRMDFGVGVVITLLLLLVRVEASQELQPPTNANNNCHELFIALRAPQPELPALDSAIHESIHKTPRKNRE